MIHSIYLCSLFFCFQAEDGIRDWSVTGVQTCALPIFGQDTPRIGHHKGWQSVVQEISVEQRIEIGRASCRKSVDLGGRRIIKKKKKRKQIYVDINVMKIIIQKQNQKK